MKWLIAALALAVGASAHNLDEYLQAALIGLSQDRVEISLRMTPGPAVYNAFAALADRDGDGRFAANELSDYAARVNKDLHLDLDGRPLESTCDANPVADAAALREGLAGLELRCAAPLPPVTRGSHTLNFRNAHQAALSVYLMNALQPGDGIVIHSQRRDSLQREIAIGFDAQCQSAPDTSWPLSGLLGACFLPLALRAAILARKKVKID